MVAEHAVVQRQLSDPRVHADPARARQLARRFAELEPVVTAHAAVRRARGDVEAATELAAADSSFVREVPVLREQLAQARALLADLLVPRDPDDDRDVIIEIKAGEGGTESALFAADLLRMYLRFAERCGWSTAVLATAEGDLGGYKSVSVAVRSRGTPAPGCGTWSRLKYEGGVHRVQRVPVTESQGRIHTSAVGVLVLPEPDETEELDIPASDLRIDVFRSSGPGGQSVNTTDSAVRITHLPTGTVVSCQNEKSQLQNREQAMRILRARLRAAAQERARTQEAEARRSQVRSVDRSERIRTYNFPENRVTDHRTGYKAYNLAAVLDGDLEAVVRSAIDADRAIPAGDDHLDR
ncbi:MAG: peptide chain release factor 1 [Angustibacter sp.]